MVDTTAAFNRSPAPAPSSIPDFELLREIGSGGFGRVWMARNLATGQLRAVKFIARDQTGKADLAGREVTAITLLEANLRRHDPSLLGVQHVGQTPTHLFYVMELADNAAAQPDTYEAASLSRRLGDGPLDAEQALACARALLAGLTALHRLGMVHRDVKPANCLFVDGELRLADFGLLTEARPQVSRAGTLKYMPPDGRMDAQGDVYAAGLVLYEMLTGFDVEQFPLLGERGAEIAADHRLAALLQVALTACETDRQLRYRDCGAMRAALEVTLAATPGRSTIWRPLAALAGLAALLAVAVWYGLSNRVTANVDVNFVTHPFDAAVLIDGRPALDADGRPAATPCTIERVPAGPHRVVFRHPQRPDLDAGVINFNNTREVVAWWPDTGSSSASTNAQWLEDR